MPKGGEPYKAPPAKGVPAVMNAGPAITRQDAPDLTVESKKRFQKDTAGKKTKVMNKGG